MTRGKIGSARDDHSVVLTWSFFLLCLYPVVREFGGSSLSLGVLFLYVALIAWSAIKSAKVSSDFIALCTTAIMLVLSAVYDIATGFGVEANYLIFLAIILISAFCSASINKLPNISLIILGISIVVVANTLGVFGYAGSYSRLDSTSIALLADFQQNRGEQLRLQTFLGLGHLRATGIFVHSNEMGMFMAGAMIVSACFGIVFVELKYKFTLFVLSLISFCFVVLSGSFTALACVALFLAYWLSRSWTIISLRLIITFLVISQLFYSEAMHALLGNDSFGWRYWMVSQVFSNPAPLLFAPNDILRFGIWTHNLIADFVLSYGLLGAALIAVLIMVTFRRVIRRYEFALWTLLGLTLLQPAGAMPSSFLFYTLSCCVASYALSRKALHNTPSSSSSTMLGNGGRMVQSARRV